MFIAMNNFTVAEGKEEEFETTWKTRESHLQGVPGFVQFMLLRGDNKGEYISHSTWQDRDAFIAWTKSEAFIAGHRQSSLQSVLTAPPQVTLYESVIVQTLEQVAAAS